MNTGGITLSPQDSRVDTGPVQAASITTGLLSAETSGSGFDFNATANTVTEIGAMHGTLTTLADTGVWPGGAGATATGIWYDTITITSDTLPAGTPVSFMATDILDRTINSMISDGNGNAVEWSADFSGPFGLNLVDSYSSPNSAETVSTVINTTVGSTLPVSSELDLTSNSEAPNPPFDGFNDVNAGDTARFDFQPITPGASYSTASGAVFVPEPASIWLMCCGLIACGLYGLCSRSAGRDRRSSFR